MDIVVHVFVQKDRPAEVKYVENRIVVEEMDRGTTWFVASGWLLSEFDHKIVGEGRAYLRCWDASPSTLWSTLPTNGSRMALYNQCDIQQESVLTMTGLITDVVGSD